METDKAKMSSRLKAGGSSKHRPGSIQKSISSFFIKPSQEKSGDKSVNQVRFKDNIGNIHEKYSFTQNFVLIILQCVFY